MDNFEENNKFFRLEGTINRRNFISNFLIVEILESLAFVTPLIFLIMFNPDILNKIVNDTSQYTYPRWISIWGLVTGLMEIGLMYPSIVKRVRDITGKYDNNNWILLIIVFALLAFLPAPPAFKQISSGIPMLIVICLMIMDGKISGEKPKSDLLRFNWGAMLGTWIWGIFNKSYLTLFAIPLFFTTGFIPFMILCGIKGNEWAYKKNKSDLESFHKSQSTQAAIFAVTMPIIFVIGSFTAVISGSVALGKYLKKHPAVVQKLDDYSAKMIKSTTEARFSKIEFTDNEYKFYLNPVEWQKMPRYGKMNLFHVIENYVLLSVYGDYKNVKDISSYIKEYNKIKIYSTFNNEILAEFYFDNDKYEELTQKLKKEEISIPEYLKAINRKYIFNEHPTLP